MNTAGQSAGTDAAAPVWALLGHKAGDNNQVLALAESLPVDFAVRRLRYRPTEILSNLLLGPNLLGIRREDRAPLSAPWPRLVISAGRRNEPVARWIQRAAPHPVRLVHVGRPWANPRRFDLIITTPQYQLPEGPNVLRLDLPLHRIDEERLAREAAAWHGRLDYLPEPRIAVLVGGKSGIYQLDSGKARRLASEASRLARELGGSLLVTTSARTPPSAAEALADSLDAPHAFHAWQPDQDANPYVAMLALADAFVVTGESMSMLAEACETRRPVHIFDMSDGAQIELTRGPARLRSQMSASIHALGWRALTHRLGQHVGPRRMRRDIGRMHRALMEAGRAVWLGDEFPDTPPPDLPGTQLSTERTMALLEETADAAGTESRCRS